jgi:L-alanine-DL-glutamate epimerase-like enolase superfamily enzyme
MQRPELKVPPLGPLKMQLQVEQWPYLAPFRITGHTREFIEVLVVSLHQDGRVGRGEAAGVRYRNDTVTRMLEQMEALRAQIETGISRDAAQMMLPAGGARNALDCALWDLEAKLSGRPVWIIAGLDKPRPLLTVFTCGADEPRAMATQARAYAQARAIKLKLTGDPLDAERVLRVREVRSDVWLSVDANQGFTLASLDKLMPTLIESRVTVIEQPFRIGEDALLDQFQSPIPIAADESAQQLVDVPGLVGRFSMVNIKLDKCGGLT